MSGSDVLMVTVMVVMVSAVAVMGYMTARLSSAVRELGEATARFDSLVVPAARRLEDAAEATSGQVDRLDDLISTTASLTDTVDHATQVTVKALSNPVIKGAAFAKGTRRAARRLRGSDDGGMVNGV